MASLSPSPKKKYGPEDDLKTFLPWQQKINRAITAFDEGRADESVALLNEAIEKRKDLAAAYLVLRHIHRVRGEPEQAAAVLEEGVRNKPENYDLVSAYGIFLVEKEEWDKGVEILEKALALVDYDPEVFNSLGFAHWKKGDEEKALKYCQKAIELDGSFAMAHSNLGALHYSVYLQTKKTPDLAKSMDHFKKAIEYDPKLAIAYRGLGMCYRIAGRADAAISVWEKSLELNPDDAFVILRIGIAHLDMGNKSQALERFEKYLALAGNSISAEERRQIEDYIRKCKKN